MSTALQRALTNISNSLTLGSTASTALSVYTSISTTPTPAQLQTLVAALAAAQANTGSTTISNNIQAVLTVAELALYGTDEIGNLNFYSTFPSDSLGVTYASMKAALLAALTEFEGDGDDLGDLIFGIVNVLNPHLSLVNLRADIAATVEGGTTLPDLVAQLITAITGADATAIGLSYAIYGGNILPVDIQHLVEDINAREALLNLKTLQAALETTANDSGSDADGFATAIYNAFDSLSLSGHQLTLLRAKEAVAAAVDKVGSLATLKANILTNLNALTDTDLTEVTLTDAMFGLGVLIPSDPFNFLQDLPAANTLLNLQNIRDALKAAASAVTFNTTSSQFAASILAAVNSVNNPITLTLAQAKLAYDIAGSGATSSVATRIYDALNSLDPNDLTAEDIKNSLYGFVQIMSGDKDSVYNDAKEEAVILNYEAIVASLVTDINAAASASALATAIYTDIAGNTLNSAALLKDVTASVAAVGSLATLKANLITALNGIVLTGTADTNVGAIRAALYGTGLLISADLSDLTADLVNIEAALDYSLLIDSVKEAGTSATDAASYAANLVSAVRDLASTSMTLNQGDLETDIQLILDGGTLLSDLVTSINTALDSADLNHAAIEAAIFTYILPSNPTRFYNDLRRTEDLMNLVEIKLALIEACTINPISPTITTAAGFASAIQTALKNGATASWVLDLDQLTKDITATINTGATTLMSLATAIKASLNGLTDNALTASVIKEALYNDNVSSDVNQGIISANPYDMLQDITVVNIAADIQTIVSALNIALDSVTINDTQYTTAYKILSAIDDYALTHDTINLTVGELGRDIAYTIDQDDTSNPKFLDSNDGPYAELARAIKLKLVGATTVEQIASAIMSSDTVIEANPRDDHASLLSSITEDALVNIISNYAAIGSDILDNLNALTGSYTSNDVATAIVNGIGASSPLLSVADLKANIDAKGSASSVATAIKGILPGSFTSAAQMTDGIFAKLAASTVNADNVLTDLGTAKINSNSYGTIAQNMYNNILSDVNPTAESLAADILNGADSVSPSGLSTIGELITSPSLAALGLQGDINNSATILTLRTNLLAALSPLASGSGVTAAAIRLAIYDASRVVADPTEAEAFEADMITAVAAHSSYATIQSNFGLHSGINNAAQGASKILETILKDHDGSTPLRGVTTTLTSDKLRDDISGTMTANSRTAQQVINTVFTSVNADVTRTAASIAADILGVNILTRTESNAVGVDIKALASGRNYFHELRDNIYNALDASFSTANEVAAAIVNAINLASPRLTIENLELDVAYTMSQKSQTAQQVADATKAALPTSGWDTTDVLNSVAIRESIFSVNSILISPANSDALLADIAAAAATLSYGGSVKSLAAKLDAALANLADPTANDLATTIVQTITPVAVNASPNLTVASLLSDITYTGGSLVTLIANMRASLAGLSISAGPVDFMNAVFGDNITPSIDDEGNFHTDIVNALEGFNDFGTVKTALGAITGTDADSIAESVQGAIQVADNAFTLDDIRADVVASVVTSYPDLATALASSVTNVNVSNSTTAAENLANALFGNGAFVNAHYANLILDFTAANDVDDQATIGSVIGDDGVCRVGASHSVYTCSYVGEDLVVSSTPLTTNKCTLAGYLRSTQICDAWGSNSGDDLYMSYTTGEGADCGSALGAFAAAYCKAGLDYIA